MLRFAPAVVECVGLGLLFAGLCGYDWRVAACVLGVVLVASAWAVKWIDARTARGGRG